MENKKAKKKKKQKKKKNNKTKMKNYEKNRESITKIIPKMRKLKNESMLIIKICLMKIEVEKDYRRYYYHKVKKLLDHLINRVEESDNVSLIFLNI